VGGVRHGAAWFIIGLVMALQTGTKDVAPDPFDPTLTER
jgi:hypothetical protein